MKIYTIGHSTRTIEEFVHLLKKYDIQVFVDVRSNPGSRHVPHFNQERMVMWLPQYGIDYIHLDDIGGRRKAPLEDMSIVQGWRSDGFKDYATYMMTDRFDRGIDTLIEHAQRRRVAYGCKEALWWKCHRRMISDALVVRGIEVYHIMDRELNRHYLPSFAVPFGKKVLYPKEA